MHCFWQSPGLRFCYFWGHFLDIRACCSITLPYSVYAWSLLCWCSTEYVAPEDTTEQFFPIKVLHRLDWCLLLVLQFIWSKRTCMSEVSLSEAVSLLVPQDMQSSSLVQAAEQLQTVIAIFPESLD